ncbi:MAG TPA: hypothetical protein VGQ59_13365 [Cyclobacteriaceae bacterium]|jgi:hypothetical protein|nr:hypothetical protein [Cyclobacteriaceae bacterium]
MNSNKQIDSKKLNRRLIEVADEAVAGARDGRISKNDAEVLLALIASNDSYTAVERATVDYIHKNYKLTESARDLFRDQIKNIEKDFQKLIHMTVEEVSIQHFALMDVLKTDEERAARKHDLKAATAETYQDHDEIGVIVRLANGKRAEVTSNFIEVAGNYVELRGGFHVPVRAIEKVEI